MAAPPPFGTEDYATALSRLSPSGSIWRTDPFSTFVRTLHALAPTYTRSTEAAAQLLIDTNPRTTVNLLEEFEATFGLPDPCTPLNPSLQQRQAAVRAAWGGRGALTPAYFIALAANLGFTITITEFTPFTVDMAVDLELLDPQWSSIWQVNAPQIVTLYFAVDESSVDDPLETYDADELVCRITRAAPADTLVLFAFS